MQRTIRYPQGEAVHIHLALRCRATVTSMCRCRGSGFTALLMISSDKAATEARLVFLPCVSSPHPHKGASSQSQCRLEGSQWVATAPRRPSSGTPHSRVYSVTDGCTHKTTCSSGQTNSRHPKENKWVRMRTHWPSCSCIHPQTCPERSPRPGMNLKGEAESHWQALQWFWNRDNIYSYS